MTRKPKPGLDAIVQISAALARAIVFALPTAFRKFRHAWLEETLQRVGQDVFELSQERCCECKQLILDPMNVEISQLRFDDIKWRHLQCTRVDVYPP